MAVLVQQSMQGFLPEERQLCLTLNPFLSRLAQPELQSSLNVPNLLATTRNAKREDGVSK